MKKYKVFIDGSQGTTGLCLHERLAGYADIEILSLTEEKRKDAQARKEMINSSDVSFLCLPDDAARESLSFVENPQTKIIDTSTAHRVNENFAYGFPELSEKHRSSIAASKRVAVPGCHATGFLALAYPLIEAGLLTSSDLLTCFSITGYSGGGKAMIAQYQEEGRDDEFDAPRLYALNQKHKHLREMQLIAGLARQPVFNPIVCDFYSGMVVCVPLFRSQLRREIDAAQLRMAYEKKYSKDRLFSVEPYGAGGGYFASNALSGSDRIEILITGNDEELNLIARFDNLGKGASGAAIQCMNLMLGFDEMKGLVM